MLQYKKIELALSYNTNFIIQSRQIESFATFICLCQQRKLKKSLKYYFELMLLLGSKSSKLGRLTKEIYIKSEKTQKRSLAGTLFSRNDKSKKRDKKRTLEPF